MAINVVVPELGESVVEATVLRWHAHEGDTVTAGQTLVELETEKVNLEVAAERGGTLTRILHKEGDDVKIGDALGVIEETVGEKQPPAPTRAAPAQETPPTGSDGGNKSRREPEPAAPEKVGAAQETRATPVARRVAEEYGVDLSQVPTTTPDRRITKQDVQSYVERSREQEAAPARPPAETERRTAAEPPVPARPAPPPSTLPPAHDGREERVRMSRRRQTIARRLVEGQHQAAMLTTFNEVDMTEVMALRRRFKDTFKERYGIGLGITSFFVKASIGALKAFPRINAEVQGDEMILKHYYDIGIAVGAEEGLVVPVLREADRLSFVEIEKAIGEFSRKAQSNSLSLEDLRGGTFTITNGGVFGSLLSTPILNPPQVAILGLHKIEERPIAQNGQVVIRPMMYVALSYDHRIVDGREAVQFLVRIKELIQDPSALLLEA